MEGQASRVLLEIDVEGMLLNWVNYVHNLIDNTITHQNQVNSDNHYLKLSQYLKST